MYVLFKYLTNYISLYNACIHIREHKNLTNSLITGFRTISIVVILACVINASTPRRPNVYHPCTQPIFYYAPVIISCFSLFVHRIEVMRGVSHRMLLSALLIGVS